MTHLDGPQTTIVVITQQELEFITNSRKSFLFNKDPIWNSQFDITMECYDGDDCANLVGLYILHKMEVLILKEKIGLYRDDGLSVVSGSGPEIERLRKKIFALFKTLNLKVTIDANITSTDFLDIPFNLKDNKNKPFRKENKTPI